MVTQGEVVRETDAGFLVFVPCSNHKDQVRRCQHDVLVQFDDGRGITPEQRRKAYVLLRYIAAWAGYIPMEAAKALTKTYFAAQEYDLRDGTFSLADCDRTTARLYITFLIEFCVLHDVPIGTDPLNELCEDIPRYVWACLMNRRCACCGGKAELHHVDAIGMGRNRKEIPQLGMKVLPLCRKHHNEIHRIGKTDFLKQYMLEAIELTEDIGRVYRLTKKNMERR